MRRLSEPEHDYTNPPMRTRHFHVKNDRLRLDDVTVGGNESTRTGGDGCCLLVPRRKNDCRKHFLRFGGAFGVVAVVAAAVIVMAVDSGFNEVAVDRGSVFGDIWALLQLTAAACRRLLGDSTI